MYEAFNYSSTTETRQYYPAVPFPNFPDLWIPIEPLFTE